MPGGCQAARFPIFPLPNLQRVGWLLARHLRPLSTSAPAVSFRGDPSVSRRGTCDRGICTKPLARRTRWSYGFRMRDSRFVRRRVGLRGVVKGVGESVGRSEEAIR